MGVLPHPTGIVKQIDPRFPVMHSYIYKWDIKSSPRDTVNCAEVSQLLWLPLQKSVSAKHILHMICTEFKTYADCIYVQNVFPSIHAPSMHMKHIHIACAQLAPFCTHANCMHLFTLF